MKLSLITTLGLAGLVVARPWTLKIKEYSFSDETTKLVEAEKDGSSLDTYIKEPEIYGSGLPYLTGYLGAIKDFTNNITEPSKQAHFAWLNLLNGGAKVAQKLSHAKVGPFNDKQALQVVQDGMIFGHISHEFFEAVLHKKAYYKPGSYSKKAVDAELKSFDEGIRHHLHHLVKGSKDSSSYDEIHEGEHKYLEALDTFKEKWDY